MGKHITEELIMAHQRTAASLAVIVAVAMTNEESKNALRLIQEANREIEKMLGKLGTQVVDGEPSHGGAGLDGALQIYHVR